MIWKKYNLQRDKLYHWNIGMQDIYVRKINREWQIGHAKSSPEIRTKAIAEEIDDPGNIEWKSFFADKNDTLQVLPALPDRPVVIKPPFKLKLLPGKNLRLFFELPVWIQFYLGTGNQENLLYEIPAMDLSSTWFGEPDNGIPSYSVKNTLFRKLEDIRASDHGIICPVHIYNQYSSQLDFQRLSLHVEFLSIYEYNSTLITNETRVNFKGENSVNEIHHSSQAPSYATNANHLNQPRNPVRSNVLKKSFHYIKSLTEY
jgi:hypothetical protein